MLSYLLFIPVLVNFTFAQLTITQTSAQDAANSLFGQSYDLGTITYKGAAAQVGQFSGGNAVNFGIDSGIILSSGSLTGNNDDEGGDGDPSIADSYDAAAIITTIQAKSTSTRALATFGSVFCTCKSTTADDPFNERAQVLINDQIVYNRSRGVEDTRPTAPFGFAVGDNDAFHNGPCKCSQVANFNLPRPVTPTDLKVVIADTGDSAYNSWIFLGFVGFQDLAVLSTTSTITVATKTISSSVTSTQLITSTTAVTIISTGSTTLPPTTKTITGTTSTTTAINPQCTTYVLQFEANCCPRSFCKKKISPPHRRQNDLGSTTTTTTTFTESDTALTTETSTVLTTSTVIATQTTSEYTTLTVTPSPSTTTFIPSATTTVCKKVFIPKFFCPRSLKAASLLSAAEKAFLDIYAKKRPAGSPEIEVHCDGDSQVYLYPNN